jgi:biopolymer transport protein ExbB
MIDLFLQLPLAQMAASVDAAAAGGSFVEEFWTSFTSILSNGGFLMGPLALLAVGTYGLAFTLFAYFRRYRFWRLDREVLLRAMEQDGPETDLGAIAAYVHAPEVGDREELERRFEEIRQVYTNGLDGRINLLMTLTTAAPLLGLLGTVMGMLTTFSGLALSVGGQTVDLIAEGISEALITTQTGLIIAIPSYVMISMLRKRQTRLDSVLNAIEANAKQRLGKIVRSQPLSASV